MSQLGFDDLLHPEDVGQPLPPTQFSQERVGTPRRAKLGEEGTTPPKSTMPFGQRPFMVKTKEEVDEHKPHQERQADTSKEHKVDVIERPKSLATSKALGENVFEHAYFVAKKKIINKLNQNI